MAGIQNAKELPPAKQTVLKQTASSESQTGLLPKEGLPTIVSSDFEEIGSLIESTTTLVKNIHDLPATTQKGYIPGIKVKGIIFFEEKSSSNHAIITTPSNSNLKLRMGDRIENSILQSIHPSRVVFLYQGELIEMSIGQ